MRVLTVLGLAFLGFLIAWGTWLVVTPDPDGGRRPVGLIILGFALVVAVGAGLLLSGRRGEDSRSRPG